MEAVRGIAEVARGIVAGIVAAVVGKAAAGIEVVVGTVVVPAPCSTYLLPRREQIDLGHLSFVGRRVGSLNIAIASNTVKKRCLKFEEKRRTSQ